MNLKQLADKVRDAVKGDEELAEPAPVNPARPVDWELPAGGLDATKAPKPLIEPPAPRPEPRPVVAREAAPREATPKPAAPRPEIGRTSDTRLGPPPENSEGAGRAGRWKASATVPDLATVYKEAGIESPLHGYGVDKLTDMLDSPHLANASREVRSTAVQVALEAARVPLRDIIDDALLRSKALAAFEADKAFDLQASQMRAERRAQVLRDQVDAFRRQKNTEIDELKRTIDAADQGLAQLRARKRREEERLYRVVTHFVEQRPAVAAAQVAPRPPAPAVTPAGPAATSFAAAAPKPAAVTPSASAPTPSPMTGTAAPSPSGPFPTPAASATPSGPRPATTSPAGATAAGAPAPTPPAPIEAKLAPPPAKPAAAAPPGSPQPATAVPSPAKDAADPSKARS